MLSTRAPVRTRHQVGGRGWASLCALSNSADGRKLLIEVTPSGRRAVNELMGLRHEWLAGSIERDLTPAEQEMLAIAAALMDRIASSQGPPST